MAEHSGSNSNSDSDSCRNNLEESTTNINSNNHKNSIEGNDTRIRSIRYEDCERVRELIIALQKFQDLRAVRRLPTVEDVQNELFYDDEHGHKLPNNLGCFGAVAEVINSNSPIQSNDSQNDSASLIVGYILYHYSYSIIEGRRMFITSFFIDQHYRRCRIGQRLMGYVIRHAHAVGITRIDVSFMKYNKAGFKFYSQYGAEIVDDEYQIYDNDLYVATAAQFSGIDSLILRSPLRTEQFNPKQLNAPNFVASFAYGEHVYFLFREIAVEYMNCGKAVYSRIARVCINDQGAAGHKSSRANGWTSFVKARLNCSFAGEFPYYFDQIQAATPVVSGVYNGARVDLVYAVLTTPPVDGGPALGASAVCAFTIPDVLDAFNGPFKGQEDTNSNWLPLPDSKMPATRPGACVSDSRRLPDDTVTFVLNNPLMDRAVPSMWSRPLVVAPSLAYRYTQIAVDPQVELPYQVGSQQHDVAHHLDVVYVATDDGRIVKLINTFALVPDVSRQQQQHQSSASSSGSSSSSTTFDDPLPPVGMDTNNNNNNNGWSLALTSGGGGGGGGRDTEQRRTKPEPGDTIIVEQMHVVDARTPIVALHVYRREHHIEGSFSVDDYIDEPSHHTTNEGSPDKDDDEPKLIVVSAQHIKAIPLYRCGRARTCNECVALRDPYCGWDLVRSVCRAHRQTTRRMHQHQQQQVPTHRMHRASSSLPHRHDGTVLQATPTGAQQRAATAQRQRLTVALPKSGAKHLTEHLVQNLTAGWSAQCPDAPYQRFYPVTSSNGASNSAQPDATQSTTINNLNECLTFCQAAAANGASVEPTMGGSGAPQASCEYTCASLASAPNNPAGGDAPALNYVPGAGLESQGYAGVNLFHPSIVTTLNGQPQTGVSSNVSWLIWLGLASTLVLGLMFGFLWGRNRGRRSASASSSKQDSSICSSTFDADTNLYLASAAVHHHHHHQQQQQQHPMHHSTHTHLSHHQLNNGNNNNSTNNGSTFAAKHHHIYASANPPLLPAPPHPVSQHQLFQQQQHQQQLQHLLTKQLTNSAGQQQQHYGHNMTYAGAAGSSNSSSSAKSGSGAAVSAMTPLVTTAEQQYQNATATPI